MDAEKLTAKARELLVKNIVTPTKKKYPIDGVNNHSPFRRSHYQERLHTFINSTHFPLSKPAPCSSLSAALNGFFLFDSENGGIECVSCHARAYQPLVDDSDAMQSAYSQYQDIHLSSCSWRVLPCLESIQFFALEQKDCSSIYKDLYEKWSQIAPGQDARELALSGWEPLTDKVGKCLFGCGTSVVEYGLFQNQHYLYCSWRWGTKSDLNGYTMMKAINK